MGLAELGIPTPVASHLEADGIRELYPPQVEAWNALKDGSNVVVAIPTASGKSLVAYLAILNRFLKKGGKALYIVPLRALASEKSEELRAFKDLGVRVAVATGDLDEKDPRLGTADIIVCTSEKADSLLRHRAPWVDQIGCVVADEMHLVHDAGRGPTLEVILSRFHALLPDAQIIGLSATIANAPDLAAWLDATLVTSDWRPVDLHKGTFLDGELKFLDHETRELRGGDPVAALVEDGIERGGQCLVFVSTRRSAEAQAVKLGGVVRDLLSPEQLAALEEAVTDLDDEDGTATAAKLQKLVRAGVAYHTAGLDAKQRRFVEDRFRQGLIKVICATPTLAAGVNTPARRVIIRDLRRFEAGLGNRPLPVMEVHQMMGRAGRPRYDPYGEAVLLVKGEEMRDIVEEEYLRGEPEPVTSKLGADASLRIHTLASIAGGYCHTDKELADFFDKTFWGTQADDWVVRDRLDDTLWFLEDHGFIERDGGRYKPTLFGKRTSDLYIDPLSALRLRTALEHERQEPTPLGILHAVAGCPDVYPLYMRQADYDWVRPMYYQVFPDLLVPDQDEESDLSYTKTAALLHDWMEETTLQELEQKFQIGPGDIRLRLDTAGWLLHAMRELARALRPEWQRAVSDMGIRLEHGIKDELLAMIRLRGVGRVRARTLWKAGFRTPAELAKAPVDRIAGLPGFGRRSALELLKQVGVNDASARTVTDEVAELDPPREADVKDPEGTSDDTDPGPAAKDDKGQVRLSAFEEP